MAREIKYRGISRQTNEWVYGIPAYCSGGAIGKICGWIGEDGFEQYQEFEVLEESIGLFTGLKDKNGKGIYEGDILKKWYSRDVSGKDIVEWNEVVVFETTHEGSGFDITFLATCEIIGNIYENPNLLTNQ